MIGLELEELAIIPLELEVLLLVGVVLELEAEWIVEVLSEFDEEVLERAAVVTDDFAEIEVVPELKTLVEALGWADEEVMVSGLRFSEPELEPI